MSEEILQNHNTEQVGSETQFLKLMNMKYTLGLLSKTDQHILLQQVKLKKEINLLGSRVEGW